MRRGQRGLLGPLRAARPADTELVVHGRFAQRALGSGVRRGVFRDGPAGGPPRAGGAPAPRPTGIRGGSAAQSGRAAAGRARLSRARPRLSLGRVSAGLALPLANLRSGGGAAPARGRPAHAAPGTPRPAAHPAPPHAGAASGPHLGVAQLGLPARLDLHRPALRAPQALRDAARGISRLPPVPLRGRRGAGAARSAAAAPAPHAGSGGARRRTPPAPLPRPTY